MGIWRMRCYCQFNHWPCKLREFQNLVANIFSANGNNFYRTWFESGYCNAIKSLAIRMTTQVSILKMIFNANGHN